MTLAALRPEDAERMIAIGAMLVDIRRADEDTHERIPGATK